MTLRALTARPLPPPRRAVLRTLVDPTSREPIDRALRRLKKKLERENIIKDVRMKRYNEKPCERRRRKEKVMAFTAMLRRKYAE